MHIVLQCSANYSKNKKLCQYITQKDKFLIFAAIIFITQ